MNPLPPAPSSHPAPSSLIASGGCCPSLQRESVSHSPGGGGSAGLPSRVPVGNVLARCQGCRRRLRRGKMGLQPPGVSVTRAPWLTAHILPGPEMHLEFPFRGISSHSHSDHLTDSPAWLGPRTPIHHSLNKHPPEQLLLPGTGPVSLSVPSRLLSVPRLLPEPRTASSLSVRDSSLAADEPTPLHAPHLTGPHVSASSPRPPITYLVLQ